MDFTTFHEAYRAILQSIVEKPGYRNAPRGFSSSEQLGVRYRLTEARQRVPMIPARRLNIVFNFAEALWYLSGRDDLEFLAYYAPSVRRYSADGLRLTGTAYGRAIFGGAGRPNQWRTVVEQLRADPDSKRAVLQIFRGDELLVPDNPDVSCTLGLQLLLRDGALQAVGFMRANDAYRGMVSDVFSLTLLQEVMAGELGVELGEYVHFVGSMHIYDTDRKRVREVLADDSAPVRPPLRFPAMPPGDNWPYIREVLRYEQPLRENRHRLGTGWDRLGLPAYWTQVLLLLEIYRAHRHDEVVDDELTMALDPLYRWLLGNWQPDLLAVAARITG